MAHFTLRAGHPLALLLVTGLLVGANRLDRSTNPRLVATVPAGNQNQMVPLVNAPAPRSFADRGKAKLVGLEAAKIVRLAENEISSPSSPRTPRKDAAVLDPSRANEPSAGRRITANERPGSAAEARVLWHEMLNDLLPGELWQLLQIGEKLSQTPRSPLLIHHLPDQSSPGQPALLPPQPRVPDSGPVSSLSNSQRPPVAEGADPESVIREALSATAQARQIIAGNLANADTPGYKRQTVSFATVLKGPPLSYEEGHKTSALESACRVSAVIAPPQTDMRQGKIRRTGRSLDVAIDGEGFFQVQRADTFEAPGFSGFYCTRCGRFSLDKHGRIVLHALKHEWILVPSIRVPEGASDIEIGTEGAISVAGPRGATESKNDAYRISIGTLLLVSLRPDCTFTPCGDNVFLAGVTKHDGFAGATPGYAGFGEVRQGCFEESNVDPQQEFEDLQKLQQHAHILERAANLLHLADDPRHESPDRPAR
jgi:flagellar basal-body rod protein FlgG